MEDAGRHALVVGDIVEDAQARADDACEVKDGQGSRALVEAVAVAAGVEAEQAADQQAIGALVRRVERECGSSEQRPLRAELLAPVSRGRQRQLAVDSKIRERKPVQLQRLLRCKGHLLGAGLVQPTGKGAGVNKEWSRCKLNQSAAITLLQGSVSCAGTR